MNSWCWASHHSMIQINPEFIFFSPFFTVLFIFIYACCWRHLSVLHLLLWLFTYARTSLQQTFTIGNFSLCMNSAFSSISVLLWFICMRMCVGEHVCACAREYGCVVVIVVAPLFLFYVFLKMELYK